MPKKPTKYLPRIADEELARRLRSMPAVLIDGPRACGKTTTARQLAASEILIEEAMSSLRLAAPETLPILKGATPRLIDEWHLQDGLWDLVRRECDRRGAVGQFILTGSADAPPSARQHTGIGRVARMQMRPLSLFESGLSTGTISLKELFEGIECSAPAPTPTLADIAEAICKGGWPLCHSMKAADAQDFNRDYLNGLAQYEVSNVDEAQRDPSLVARLLQSLARNISTEASLRTLSADTGGAQPIDPRTTATYLSALESLFIVDDLPAWNPQLRSRSRLRNTPKRQLVDPSLATAALGTNTNGLLADLETLGLMFESLCVRDLRAYCQPMKAELSHYRDNTGLEIDTIIKLGNSDWIGVEIKLGGTAAVEGAAASLTKLRDERLDLDKVGAPRRLVVLTATGYAYERTDGVSVVPITALGP